MKRIKIDLKTKTVVALSGILDRKELKFCNYHALKQLNDLYKNKYLSTKKNK